MSIYTFSFKQGRRLTWIYVKANSTKDAILRMREQIGPDLEPYAGPLPQKCSMKGCDKQADDLYGDGRWLPLCEKHSNPFPWHASYHRK